MSSFQTLFFYAQTGSGPKAHGVDVEVVEVRVWDVSAMDLIELVGHLTSKQMVNFRQLVSDGMFADARRFSVESKSSSSENPKNLFALFKASMTEMSRIQVRSGCVNVFCTNL